MKIIFIGHSGAQYPHTRVRCYGFAKAMKDRGFETEVLSFKDHLAPHLKEEDMYANLRDRDKIGMVLRAARKLFKQRDALFYVQKAHFHTAAPYLLSRFAGAKFILDYDDYDVPLSNFFHRGRYNRLFFGSSKWDVITERIARKAVGCVASSHALEDYLKKFNSKVVRVETGVDTGIFRPPMEERSEDEPITFLWNGLVWGDEIYRSVMMAIEAFARVHAEYPRTRLILVGAGFQWQRLVDDAKQQYDHVPILFRGWFPPESMPSVLREADVGILPFAVDNEWVRSKSPTKLFEYLASGLSVVASRVGEVQYVIQHGENGWLASDIDEMAEGMRVFAKDREFRRKIGHQARLTAIDRYSHEVLGDRLAGFLRQFT